MAKAKKKSPVKKSKSKTQKRKKVGKRGPKAKKGQVRYRNAKNVGLNKHHFSKIKQEYHDIDYAHLLSPEEKKWLSVFFEEDLGARMNHPGKKIYTKKEDIKNVYGRNNARNRDVYSIAKATGRTVDLPYELLPSQHTDAEIDYNFEDDLIEQIDASREDPEDSV